MILFFFVLDKKGENIVFIVLIDKKGEKDFLPLFDIVFIVLVFTPLLMIDKKGEKDFEFVEFYIYAYLCFCIY